MGRGGLNMSEVRTYARAGSYVCLGRKAPAPPAATRLYLSPSLLTCGRSAAAVLAFGLVTSPLDSLTSLGGYLAMCAPTARRRRPRPARLCPLTVPLEHVNSVRLAAR